MKPTRMQEVLAVMLEISMGDDAARIAPRDVVHYYQAPVRMAQQPNQNFGDNPCAHKRWSLSEILHELTTTRKALDVPRAEDHTSSTNPGSNGIST